MPKASNFTSGGVQNRDTKSRFLSHFLIELINLLRNGTIVRCLWENKKTSGKYVFREAWSPELTSQSFPAPCFWSRGFVPHRKWNLMHLVHQNTGKENRYGKNFFVTLISPLGRFDRADKKVCNKNKNITTCLTKQDQAGSYMYLGYRPRLQIYITKIRNTVVNKYCIFSDQAVWNPS